MKCAGAPALIVCLLLIPAWLVAACARQPVVQPTPLPPSLTAAPTAIATPAPTETILPTAAPTPTPLALTVPPRINLLAVTNETASFQLPAYVEVEVIGLALESARYLAGRYEPDGRRRLVAVDMLAPEASGGGAPAWQNGPNRIALVWNTAAPVLLEAGGQGDLAVTQPLEDDRYGILGRYRPAGGEPADAWLLFDATGSQFEGIRRREAPPGDAPLQPSAGDSFQLYHVYLGSEGVWLYEPGKTMALTEAGGLSLEWRPLPAGDYLLSFSATDSSGQMAETTVELAVENDSLQPDYAAYLDPTYAFQFLYPQAWGAPQRDRAGCSGQPATLCTGDAAGRSWLSISPYPDAGQIAQLSGDPGADALAFKEAILPAFGQIDLLFERPIEAGGIIVPLTVYGYQSPDGPRTGFFFTLIRDNVGYLVDLDGPAEQESENLDLILDIAESWQFRSIGQTLAGWQERALDNTSLFHPADFAHHEVNGWQRFSQRGGDAFIALKSLDGDDREAAALLAAYLEDAASGVAAFQANPPTTVALNGRLWWCASFSYENETGAPVRGAILVRPPLVVWYEASAALYEELEEEIFLVVVGSLRHGR